MLVSARLGVAWPTSPLWPPAFDMCYSDKRYHKALENDEFMPSFACTFPVPYKE